MLGEWYLPPGMCQVILTITEGTISFSRPSIKIRRNENYPNSVLRKQMTPESVRRDLPPDQEF